MQIIHCGLRLPRRGMIDVTNEWHFQFPEWRVRSDSELYLPSKSIHSLCKNEKEFQFHEFPPFFHIGITCNFTKKFNFSILWMFFSYLYIFLSIFFPHQILEWWHNICSKSRGRLVKTLIRISENTTHGGPTLLFL